MPVPVACPSCGARMSAPDDFAGKKVKCPKCASAVVVPAAAAEGFDVVDDSPGVKKPKPVRPKPLVIEDDPPRPKKVKKSMARSGIPVWLVLVVVGAIGVFGLAAVAIAAFILRDPAEKPAPPVAARPAPEPEPEKPAKPAVNWVRFNQQGVPFTAEFPNGPPAEAGPAIQGMIGEARAAMQALGLDLKPRTWSRADGGRVYAVTVAHFPKALQPTAPPGTEDILKDVFGGGGVALPPALLNAAPRDVETRVGQGVRVSRELAVRGVVFVVQVDGPAGLTLTDERVRRFFESFRERVPADPPAKGKK